MFMQCQVEQILPPRSKSWELAQNKTERPTDGYRSIIGYSSSSVIGAFMRRKTVNDLKF